MIEWHLTPLSKRAYLRAHLHEGARCDRWFGSRRQRRGANTSTVNVGGSQAPTQPRHRKGCHDQVNWFDVDPSRDLDRKAG